ncbi:MAG: type IV pilin protein [Methylococcales bacterium]
MNKTKKGFTLIELMVVVAIIGILASIAYPSYQDSVTKSRRRDATGALVGLANAMERYYTENNTYTGAAGTVGTPADTGAPRIFSIKSPIDGSDKYYDLKIQAANANTYTLRATPFGSQVSDSCGNLELTQTGAKTPTTSGCW